ncbi:beta-galactosidase [Kineococcus sp. R86509]|uniref:beta-galactosidase n=1 Tax=Kineococcus sp. R86509 TaxID=3093851 RepID=UPI0036D2FE69
MNSTSHTDSHRDSQPRPANALLSTSRFGGDYNPEQWESQVWDEDVRLMHQAGVNLATVGVFSWSRLEPRPGQYEFSWLDDVLDRLHAGGVDVLLATATASPPAWFTRSYPQSLPVTAEGVRLGFGSRQHYSPSSAAYREHALRLVEQIAARYGQHPAVVGWHVNNEYGCHVMRSYDDESAAAFRRWLSVKYSTIEQLNHAWGTDFWSQRYDSFDEVDVPRAMPSFPNPTQLLDFDRFSSDAMLALYRAEVEVLRRHTPTMPVTTNFMGFFPGADYWQWAPHLDVISDDAYPDPADPESYVGAAAQRDLMRSLGEGRPWLLMESATTAVQWRTVNASKPAGMYRSEQLTAVARGADGVLHFQWRQSKAGAEKFHAAMLPHAGTDTRVFREVCALGAELAELAPRVLGADVSARAAIIVDWDSWRAVGQPANPTHTDYHANLLAWYRPFLRRGITVDFCPVRADLSNYDIVVAPMLHVVSQEDLEHLDTYARSGGHLVVTHQSAILDRDLHVWLNGYLGPLQQTLGIRLEEWTALGALASGQQPTGVATKLVGPFAGQAYLWQDVVAVIDAHTEVLSTFADGFAAGRPALTRRSTGTGAAWYVSTLPDEAVLDALIERWSTEADVKTLLQRPTSGVEAVERGDLLIVVNRTAERVQAALAEGVVDLAPFEVRIEERRSTGASSH